MFTDFSLLLLSSFCSSLLIHSDCFYSNFFSFLSSINHGFHRPLHFVLSPPSASSSLPPHLRLSCSFFYSFFSLHHFVTLSLLIFCPLLCLLLSLSFCFPSFSVSIVTFSHHLLSCWPLPYLSFWIFLLLSPPSSSPPPSIPAHTPPPIIFLSSIATSPGSQQRSAVHLQPRGGGGSHASGWTWGSHCPRLPPPLPLPQPTHPPPHGDRLHGDHLHAHHGTGQQQQRWRVRPAAVLLPVSAARCQRPHEPDLVPWGVRFSLFKSRLFLFLQRSLAAAPGRGHGRVIPDWQPKHPIRGGRGGGKGAKRVLKELYKSKFATSPFNQSHLSVWSISDFISLCPPAEVFWSQKYTQMNEGRKQREREDGEDRENCRMEGRNLKPNNDLQLERWHWGVFLLGIGGTNTTLFIGWRKKKELNEGRDENWKLCVRDGRQQEKTCLTSSEGPGRWLQPN